MIKLEKDDAYTITVLEDGKSKGGFSAPARIVDELMQMQGDAGKYRVLLADGFVGPAAEPLLTDIPIKVLKDLDALYAQTVADPNADDPYLRGYTNGIRLMHATLHGREPDFVKAPEQEAKGGPELPPYAQFDVMHVSRDRPVIEFYVDELKKLTPQTEFERRLLCILDVLVKDNR